MQVKLELKKMLFGLSGVSCLSVSRISLENIISQHTRGGFQQPYEQEYSPPPPDILPSQWREPRKADHSTRYTNVLWSDCEGDSVISIWYTFVFFNNLFSSPEGNMTPPVVYTPPESRRHSPNPSESRSDYFTPAEKTEIDINTVSTGIELFTARSSTSAYLLVRFTSILICESCSL